MQKCRLLICRANWSGDNASTIEARNLISSLRMNIDEKLIATQGVQFFLSCITGTTSNKEKEKRSVSPGIAYYIAFSPTGACQETTLYNLIHDNGFDPQMKVFKCSTDNADEVVQELGRCVKDHSDKCVTDIGEGSNRFCLSRALVGESSTQDANEVLQEISFEAMKHVYRGSNLCPVPCRLVCVNNQSFGTQLEEAYRNLNSEGFRVSEHK